MWIRTQDKKELVNVNRVFISKIFGDRNNNAAIWGEFKRNSIFSENKILLGRYATIDDAIKEIDEIQKCITENLNNTYQMR